MLLKFSVQPKRTQRPRSQMSTASSSGGPYAPQCRFVRIAQVAGQTPHLCSIFALVVSGRERLCLGPDEVTQPSEHRMLKSKLMRGVTGRRFGKKAVALAMAPIGVAAVSFAGLAITAPGAYAATGCVTRTSTFFSTKTPTSHACLTCRCC